MKNFTLPDEITNLIEARNQLRRKYIEYDLNFTLDGNLVGDIGEAIAAQLFGLQLAPPNQKGYDATTIDGETTVQIKATGTGGKPAFTKTDVEADYLLFLDLDFEKLTGEVKYNGPFEFVRKHLPEEWNRQKGVSLTNIKKANLELLENQRLKPV